MVLPHVKELSKSLENLSNSRNGTYDPDLATAEIMRLIEKSEKILKEGNQLRSSDGLEVGIFLARAYSAIMAASQDLSPFFENATRLDNHGFMNRYTNLLISLCQWIECNIMPDELSSEWTVILKLELQTLKAQSVVNLFGMSNPSALGSDYEATRQGLISLVDSISSSISESASRFPDDTDRTYAWAFVVCNSLFRSLRADDRIVDLAEDQIGVDVRLQIDYYCMQLREAICSSDRLDVIDAILSKSRSLGAPFSLERANFIGRFGWIVPDSLFASAVNEPGQCARVAQVATRWNSWATTDDQERASNSGIWHIIANGTNIAAINDMSGQLILDSLDSRHVEAFVVAAMEDSDAQHEELRKKLARSVKKITAEILESENPRLNLIGYAARLPWLSFGDLARSGAILNPYPKVADVPELAPAEARKVLFVDLSMEESVKIKEIAGSDGWEMIEFDSTICGQSLTIRQIDENISNSTAIAFFCHGVNDEVNYPMSGLFLGLGDSGDDCRITPEDISRLCAHSCSEAVIVACQSGNANFRIPASAISSSFAFAGASTVIGTLWSIERRLGQDFLCRLLLAKANGNSLEKGYRDLMDRDKKRFSAFALQSSSK